MPFFAFKRPLDVLLSLPVSNLTEPKIDIFRHIKCEFWLHGTAVEITVGNGKTEMKRHNMPQPWLSCATMSGELCQPAMPGKVLVNTLKVIDNCC